MITLTYFGDRRPWPGRRISIACKHPPWGRVQGDLPIFKPPWEWVVATKNGTMDDEAFVRQFTELLRVERWDEIQGWADQYHTSPEDLVLMCWEKDPLTCHREQVFYLLRELDLPCKVQLV